MNSDKKLKILLAGESWMTQGIHGKGFSAYLTSTYDEGVEPLRNALVSAGHDFTYITNHKAREEFPKTIEELNEFDVVILSDISADTLLLRAKTFAGEKTPNRLELLVSYVRGGGGFLMIGGYMSFSGFGGKANYHFSPIINMLPVELYGYDDRVEIPEGLIPEVIDKNHPIVMELPLTWPCFLGYNKLKASKGHTIMACKDDPFLAVCDFGKGRTAVFASDCSPHWAPKEFTNWEHYDRFWNQLVLWLAKSLE